MGTSSHAAATAHEAPAADPVDTADSLMAEVRAQGISVDASIAPRIDAAIELTADDGDLGTLHIARATVFQGDGDASISAAAAQAAIAHFVSAGRTSEAALASVMAACFLDQGGDTSVAVELAVDALVMLGDSDVSFEELPAGLAGVRAALGLSGFFMRQSAFDLALAAGLRAFEGGKRLCGGLPDPVAFSFGYLASEAAHVTANEATRDRALAHVQDVVDSLELPGPDDSGRTVLTSALRGEIRHARGKSSSGSGLDDAEALYPECTADLVAWHRLVRGTSALIDDRFADAIGLLDAALPSLEGSADHHCVARCLRARSRAYAELGDHRRAHRDSLDLADRTRRWQIDQVGHLADQLARRADLERSTSELRETAARLADDIDRDAITGVHSRRWLERHLDDLSESVGYGAVIMCDIDRFKRVNDTHGHHVGDAVLHRFATLLDGVSSSHPGGVVARFGGEEFVAVLDRAESASAADVADQIRVATRAYDWSAHAPGLELSVSCGVATGPLSEVRGLLLLADHSLLAAKRQGRNRVVSASDESTA